MTLEELLNMPKGMKIEQWQEELRRREKIDRKIRSLSNKIQDCEDALDVLSDEKGSDRYNKWLAKLAKYEAQKNKYEAMERG